MQYNKCSKLKGDPTDIILFIVIIFFLAVSFVVVLFVNTKISEVISTTVLSNSSAAPSIISGLDNINTTVTQRGFVLVFALFIIGLMISSFLVRVHPIFIFIYIFTLVMSILLAVYLTNTYQLIIENEQLATIAANYTMITWIMHNSVKILVAVGSLTMIITFSKLFSGPGATGGDSI